MLYYKFYIVLQMMFFSDGSESVFEIYVRVLLLFAYRLS